MNDLVPSHSLPPQISHAGAMNTALGGPLPMEEEKIGLRDYYQFARKHVWLIGACVVGTSVAATLTILTIPPEYTAQTTLLIERQAPQVLDFREVLTESGKSGPNEFYKTQYEILRSRTLATAVIREQRLETDPAFTGEKSTDSWIARQWAKVQGGVRAAKGWLRSFFPAQPQSAGANSLSVKPGIVDAYLRMLAIVPSERTQLVKIVFNTPNPDLSARLANAHAQAYVHQGLQRRMQANAGAEEFLQERLGGLKERVEQSEAALNRYRQGMGIISLDDRENIVVDRLADLNKRLTEAEAERIAIESQVELVRKRRYESLPAVANNNTIHVLTGQIAQMEGEYATLVTIFKPGHPRLAQIQAQLKAGRRHYKEELEKVVEGIESTYLAAVTKEKQLRAAMEKQKAAALRLKSTSVEYAVLAREVDTNRQLYDSVLQRMKETGVAAELRTSNIFVIDAAEPARAPSSPKVTRSILMAALLGLMGGVGVAFLREHLSNTLKTPRDVERYLGLPNLGTVPDFVSLNWRRHTSTLQIPSHLPSGEENGLGLRYHPLLMVTEAYRTLRTAILLSRAEEPPKTILFTSATHSEGKTATVINTAIVFAQMGVKVLVIDADLRRPSCHQVLGVQRRPGLTEVLTGCGESLDLIQPTYTTDLSLLSSGSAPPNPAELVGSRRMRETLTALCEHYDYILIDSPPVMPVSDAVLLSTMVDGVVLVVDSKQPPKQVIREAYTRLTFARAKVLGTVLNRADFRDGNYAYTYYPYNQHDDQAEDMTRRR